MCQRAADPDFYLTFSWGAPLPRAGLSICLRDTQQSLRAAIDDDGMADEPIPLSNMNIALESKTEISIYLRSYKVLFRSQVVTFAQTLKAVDLLEFCGLYRGNYEEMWTYVFAGRRQIGYLTLEWDPWRLPDNDQRNRTSVVSNA